MTIANVRVPSYCVIFSGQSLNNVTDPQTNANRFPNLLMSGRVSTFVEPTFTAISGNSWTQLATQVSVRLNQYADEAPTTILSMLGGNSDLVTEGDSGATVYSDMKSYAVAAKAAGFDKIMAITVTSSTSYSADVNTRRKALNDLLIGNADSAWDAVVDLACDSSLSNPGAPHSGTTWYGTGLLTDPSNATYYQVGQPHMTLAGCTQMATEVAPALTALGAT